VTSAQAPSARAPDLTIRAPGMPPSWAHALFALSASALHVHEAAEKKPWAGHDGHCECHSWHEVAQSQVFQQTVGPEFSHLANRIQDNYCFRFPNITNVGVEDTQSSLPMCGVTKACGVAEGSFDDDWNWKICNASYHHDDPIIDDYHPRALKNLARQLDVDPYYLVQLVYETGVHASWRHYFRGKPMDHGAHDMHVSDEDYLKMEEWGHFTLLDYVGEYYGQNKGYVIPGNDTYYWDPRRTIGLVFNKTIWQLFKPLDYEKEQYHPHKLNVTAITSGDVSKYGDLGHLLENNTVEAPWPEWALHAFFCMVDCHPPREIDQGIAPPPADLPPVINCWPGLPCELPAAATGDK